jgi:hypothetical protein
LLATLITPLKSKKEAMKRDTIKTARMYLELFKTQVLDGIPEKAVKSDKMCQTSFLPALTDQLLLLAGDYHDSVRDETC